MNLIAIETSADACSAALWSDDQVHERFQIAPREHSELILPMVAEVLAEGGIGRSQLDGVIFGRGPGSFTGVRIATGVAQGLAFALDLPVVPVSTLEVLAQGVHRESGSSRVLAAFDARMAEVYWACCTLGEHELMQIEGEEMVCAPDEVPLPAGKDWTGAGSGWRTYSDTFRKHLGDQVAGIHPNALCHASDAALIGAPRFLAGDVLDAARALPVYLRNRVAWKKT